MRINNVNSTISFKRAITSIERPEYIETLKKAREVANNGGKSIFIVHDTCLPQAATTDTGVGHLTSKTSGKFFDFIKTNLGINTVEVLPQGEIQLRHGKGFYNAYNGSALSLGTQEIDLELLTTPRHNSILEEADFQEVVKANQSTMKEGFVNYENVVGANSPQEKALRKAYDKFIGTAQIDKTAFETFKKENADWLEKKAIYGILKQENGGKEWQEWASEIDKTLFDQNGTDHTKRLTTLRTEKAADIDFYMFKQYLADDHLKLGRQIVNEKEMKLIGDCLIGFSQDEVWANKKAFMDGVFIGEEGWKIPALNYNTITDPQSDAQKLLRRKVELFAKRYDGIRFDCSWSYVKPKLSDSSKFDFEGSILDIIEDTVKQVKGTSYDQSLLIHEFEADPKDFGIFDELGRIKSYLKDRVKVVSSAFLSDEYGSVAYMNKVKAAPEEYVLGVGNHDPQPLKQMALNIPDRINGKNSYRRAFQERILSRLMNLPAREVHSPAGFSKAKFAEPLTGKNQMVFYMDALGRTERFDSQAENGWKNYRYRISTDYAKEYQNAVQNGFGYNPMDGYEKVFKLKGLDKSHPSLFKDIQRFNRILAEKADGLVTRTQTVIPDITKNKFFGVGLVVAGIALITTVLTKAKSDIKDLK